MATFRRIAERNQEKASIRHLRARRLGSQEDDGEVWGEDSFLDEPSADESLPPETSDIPFTLSSRLSLALASPDPRLTFSSAKRSGETPESESFKERRKEGGSVRAGAQVDVHVTANQNPAGDVNLADYGIIPINEDLLRLAVARRIYRIRLICPQRVGRPTELFMGATVRFPSFMNSPRLRDWKVWIQQPLRTEVLEEISPPGPWSGRGLRG